MWLLASPPRRSLIQVLLDSDTDLKMLESRILEAAYSSPAGFGTPLDAQVAERMTRMEDD